MTDDKGDFNDALQTFQEGIEASIWVTHSVTSTQCKLALPQTAIRNIQTIINVSGQELDKDEYAKVYTAIPELLARAYRNWKATLWASTPELKVEGHPIGDTIPASTLKPENSREQDLPPHMASPLSDSILHQVVDQINAPHQYGELTEDFER